MTEVSPSVPHRPSAVSTTSFTGQVRPISATWPSSLPSQGTETARPVPSPIVFPATVTLQETGSEEAIIPEKTTRPPLWASMAVELPPKDVTDTSQAGGGGSAGSSAAGQQPFAFWAAVRMSVTPPQAIVTPFQEPQAEFALQRA